MDFVHPDNWDLCKFEPILGKRPKNMSPNVISRLKASWYSDYEKMAKKRFIIERICVFLGKICKQLEFFS